MLAVTTANATSRRIDGVSAFGQTVSSNRNELMACISTTESYRAKQTIIYEGDEAGDIFEVRKGVVKLYKLLCDGRCQVTGFLYPGQFFGLEYRQSYLQTAEAVTAAELCRYSKTRLEKAMSQHPSLANRFLSQISSELVTAQDQMLLLGRKSATERFSSFLLRLVAEAERRGENPDKIYLPMSRGEIGDYLGMTTETVCRTVRRLKELSVIGLPDARHVAILDHDYLEDLAEDQSSFRERRISLSPAGTVPNALRHGLAG